MHMLGYVDGQEIRFDFCPPSTFKAIIPEKKSGTCIIELHAVDDAGNIASYCGTVVMIDFDNLYFKIIRNDYSEKMFSEIIYHEVCQNYEVKVFPGFYAAADLRPMYVFKELV